MWNKIFAGLIAILLSALLVRADSINIPTNYAEGTWTPSLTGSATPGTGQTYNAQVGYYQQIGRQVTANFNIQATSLGTAAGNLQISNLPFTAANVTNNNGSCFVHFYSATGLAALDYGLTGNIIANTSQVVVYQNSSTASANLTIAQAGNSIILIGSCNYRV